MHTEKEWTSADDERVRKIVDEEVSQLTEQERYYRVRQMIYEDKFKHIAARATGTLTPKDNAEAIRQADTELSSLTAQQIRRKLVNHLAIRREIGSKAEKEKWTDADMERVRIRMEERFLGQYPPDRHAAILRGAMVSVHMSDPPGSDAAVWLRGRQTENGRLPGIAEKTILALREIGLLNEISQSENGVITYPGAIVQEPTYQTTGIRNAWFTWYQNHAREEGLPVPAHPKEMDKKQKKWAKKQLEEKAKSTLRGCEIEIRKEDDHLVAITSKEKRPIGRIERNSALEEGQIVTIQGVVARDGGLRLAFE